MVVKTNKQDNSETFHQNFFSKELSFRVARMVELLAKFLPNAPQFSKSWPSIYNYDLLLHTSLGL